MHIIKHINVHIFGVFPYMMQNLKIYIMKNMFWEIYYGIYSFTERD